MQLGEVVRILSEVGLSAVAAFLAIFLWSVSRDSAWIFIVLGTIFKFGDVMYGTMEMFGIIPEKLFLWQGGSLVKIVLVNVPYIFFIFGFSIMIFRNRLRLETLGRALASSEERKKSEDRKKIEKKAKKAKKERKPREKKSKRTQSEDTTQPGDIEGGPAPISGVVPNPAKPVPESPEDLVERENLEEAESMEELEEVEELEEMEAAESVEAPGSSEVPEVSAKPDLSTLQAAAQGDEDIEELEEVEEEEFEEKASNRTPPVETGEKGEDIAEAEAVEEIEEVEELEDAEDSGNPGSSP